MGLSKMEDAPSSLIPDPGVIRAGGSDCKSPIEEVVGDWGLNLCVCIWKAHSWVNCLRFLRILLALGGAVVARPQMSEHQTIENERHG